MSGFFFLFLGFTVLERSKLMMAREFHDTIVPHFKEVQLLTTDTDSFIIKVRTDNLEADLKVLEEKFDFSNFPKDSKLHSKKAENHLGRFKVETCGMWRIQKGISLRNKVYSLKLEPTEHNRQVQKELKEMKVLKGVAKSTVENHITFAHYENALFNAEEKHVNFTRIQSKDFKLSTVQQNKKALAAFEDKR